VLYQWWGHRTKEEPFRLIRVEPEDENDIEDEEWTDAGVKACMALRAGGKIGHANSRKLAISILHEFSKVIINMPECSLKATQKGG